MIIWNTNNTHIFNQPLTVSTIVYSCSSGPYQGVSTPQSRKNVVPIVTMQQSFKIYNNDLEKNNSCQQLPITATYAFTDYRSQGQMIPYALIDIACPLTGGLMPFNMNVALSRARRKDNIRLLRNFDAKPLTTHPNEHLRTENERLRACGWWELIQKKNRSEPAIRYKNV